MCSKFIQWIRILMFELQVFCWMDKWHGMTMADIRALEEETKAKLDEERNKVWRKNLFEMFDQFDLNISGWNQGHCSTGEVRGVLSLLKELATISTTVTSLCLPKKANKGTVTFCLRIEQSSSATCRNHSWAQSNWGLCWGVGFVMFWIQLLWYL